MKVSCEIKARGKKLMQTNVWLKVLAIFSTMISKLIVNDSKLTLEMYTEKDEIDLKTLYLFTFYQKTDMLFHQRYYRNHLDK